MRGFLSLMLVVSATVVSSKPLVAQKDFANIMAQSDSSQKFTVEIIFNGNNKGKKEQRFAHHPFVPDRAGILPDKNVGQITAGKHKVITRVKTSTKAHKDIPVEVMYSVRKGHTEASAVDAFSGKEVEIEVPPGHFVLVTVKRHLPTWNAEVGKISWKADGKTETLPLILQLEKPYYFDGAKDGLRPDSNNMTLLVSSGTYKVMEDIAAEIADDIYDRKARKTDWLCNGFRVVFGSDNIGKLPAEILKLRKDNFKFLLNKELVRVCNQLVAGHYYPVFDERKVKELKAEGLLLPERIGKTASIVLPLKEGHYYAQRLLNEAAKKNPKEP